LQLFEELLHTPTEINTSELKLQIIKNIHGSSDFNTKEKVKLYINELLTSDNPYKIFALYWKAHIDTEKGVFNIEQFENIRRQIAQCSDDFINIKSDTLKRCYTDELRCYHILGLNPPENLISEFNQFLSSFGENYQKYYFNLYGLANRIHYIDIPKSIFDIRNCLDKALFHYELALDSGYEEVKSLKATNVKRLELELFREDFDYPKLNKSLNNFITYAELNKIHVFMAYAYTFKAKIEILHPDIINNTLGLNFDIGRTTLINNLLSDSKKIYTEYENLYGIFRAEFLELLFGMLMSRNGNDTYLDKINILLEANISYLKERELFNEIYILNAKRQLTKNSIIQVIRCYPMILQ